MSFLTLLRLMSGAYLRQRPLKVFLTVLGMASGIAVFIAIQIANQSILYSFENSIEQLSGQADLTIFPQARKLKDADYVRVKKIKGVSEVSPLIEAFVTCMGQKESVDPLSKKISLLGIDPISRAAFFSKKNLKLSSSEKKLGEQIFNLMMRPGWVLVPKNFLEECPQKSKSIFELSFSGKILRFPYQVYESQETQWETAPPLLTDIASAQELLGMIGELSQIDVQLQSQEVEEWIEQNLSQFEPDLRVVSQKKRLQQGQSLLSAFQHNLISLGLISIFVAVFIVYNAASISLLYRRSQLAVLRALGASRPKVWVIFLIEIFILGLVSSALGIVLGWLIANLIFGQVLETVNQHYLSGFVGVLYLSNSTIFYGLALGTLASLLGALLPLLEASSVSPVEATRNLSYEKHIRKHPYLLLSLFFLMMLLAGFSYQSVSFSQPNWAFLVAFSALLSILCLTPFLLRWLLQPLKIFFRRTRQASALMSSVQILENPYRYSMVTAALALAISLWIGIGMMVSSFRLSLEDWLQDSVPGDIYVDLESRDQPLNKFLPQELYSKVSSWPEIDWIDTLRTFEVDYHGEVKKVSSIRLSSLMQKGYMNLLAGQRESFSEEEIKNFKQSSSPIFLSAVSESFAQKNRLRLDDVFLVQSPWGKWSFKIKAILYDYSSEQGVLYIDHSQFSQWHFQRSGSVDDIDKYEALAFYLKDSSQKEQLLQRLLTLAESTQGLRVRSQQEVYDRVLSIFDQTFQVTQALRVVALFVAFLGILSTLALLMEEKRREVGLLQAVGMDPVDIYRYGFYQGILLAWVGYVIGAIAGVTLCWIIIKVVHYYFFGWSIRFYFNFSLLLQSLILTLSTGAIASLWGIYSLKKLQPADALRFDE
ncbi:MAG: ABC transporter permease [Deltaproteobacteria bacterium]|nr:ABC transporter permease [Deltaproteobacteria bacterium]